MKSFFHLTLWSLIAAATMAGYGYWYARIADKSAIVAELQAQIDSKSEAASRIASARATLSEISKDEAVVQSYFVPETAVVPFINDLEARARMQKAALKVLSVSTSGTPAQPTLTLALALDGSFDAVMRTLGAIEYAPYYLSITKVSLIENGEGVWHADLEMIVGSVSSRVATSTRLDAPKAPVSAPISYDYF